MINNYFNLCYLKLLNKKLLLRYLFIISICFLSKAGFSEDYRWFYGESPWVPNNKILSEIDNYATNKQLLFKTQEDRLWAISSAYERFEVLYNWQKDYIMAIKECKDRHFKDKKNRGFWMDTQTCITRKDTTLGSKYSNKLTSEVLQTGPSRAQELSLNARAFSEMYYSGYLNRDNFVDYLNEHLELEKQIIKTYFERQVYVLMASLDPIYLEIAGEKNNENKPKKNQAKESSGTGFFINEFGHIVTNFHVIEGCKNIYQDEELLKVIAKDQINDLAILKGTNQNKKYLLFEKDLPKKGEEVLVSGYPFGKDFGDESKLTEGIISALQGMGNDYTRFQIDAAIQPGNSGGPVLNKKGNVIGVAVASANIQAFLEQYGTIPQNKNFAIQSTTLMMMLITNKIEYKSSPQKEILSNSVISRETEEAVVFLKCVY